MSTYKAMNFKVLHTNKYWCIDNLYRDCIEDFIKDLFKDYVMHSEHKVSDRLERLINKHANKISVKEDTEVFKLTSNEHLFKGHCSEFLPYITGGETRSDFWINGEEMPFEAYKKAVNEFVDEYKNGVLFYKWPVMTIHIVQIIDQYYTFYTLEE